jgi:hypothetical protein
MADAPVLGPPTAICTHPDGRFSVEFGWVSPPDALWLKALGDLMRRSGRESVDATAERVTLLFDPQDAEGALEEMTALLAEADFHYGNDLERRDAALRHVQESLRTRFDVEADLPVREL